MEGTGGGTIRNKRTPEEIEENRKRLEAMVAPSAWMKCEICGKRCPGLMSFASHVAQDHGISAFQYWARYGHHGEIKNENINPSKRSQDIKPLKRN